jgi:hypothetical protein
MMMWLILCGVMFVSKMISRVWFNFLYSILASVWVFDGMWLMLESETCKYEYWEYRWEGFER